MAQGAQDNSVLGLDVRVRIEGGELSAWTSGLTLQCQGSPRQDLMEHRDAATKRTFTVIESCATYGPCDHAVGVPFDGIATNPVNSSIRTLASYRVRLYVGTFNLTGGQSWSYDASAADDEAWSYPATVPAAGVSEPRVLGDVLFVGASGGAPNADLYRYTSDDGLSLVPAPTNPLYLATSLGTPTLFTTPTGVLSVGTIELEHGFTLPTTTDGESCSLGTADGFGQPRTGYAWSMAALNGRVFVGTFSTDFGNGLRRGPAALTATGTTATSSSTGRTLTTSRTPPL